MRWALRVWRRAVTCWLARRTSNTCTFAATASALRPCALSLIFCCSEREWVWDCGPGFGCGARYPFHTGHPCSPTNMKTLHLFNNMCGGDGAKALADIILQSPQLEVRRSHRVLSSPCVDPSLCFHVLATGRSLLVVPRHRGWRPCTGGIPCRHDEAAQAGAVRQHVQPGDRCRPCEGVGAAEGAGSPGCQRYQCVPLALCHVHTIDASPSSLGLQASVMKACRPSVRASV